MGRSVRDVGPRRGRVEGARGSPRRHRQRESEIGRRSASAAGTGARAGRGEWEGPGGQEHDALAHAVRVVRFCDSARRRARALRQFETRGAN